MADVFVSFGGDTGALEAALAAVKAEMSDVSSDLRKAAREFTRTGAAAESELGQKLKSLGSQMAETKAHLGSLQSGAKTGGDAVKQLAERVGEAAYQYGPWTGAHVQLAQAAGVGLVNAFRNAGLGAGVLGGAIGVAAAASAAAAIIVAKQAAGLRDLDDAARTANVSITALKNLNAAGKNVGLEADKMNSEMGAFAVKLREAQVAGGELADFLKANNIAIKDSQGNLRPVQQIFGEIAEMVLKTTNEMDRMKTMETVGFSGETLRLIERQTDAVREFAASTKEAGAAQEQAFQKTLTEGEKVSAAFRKLGEEASREITNAAVAILNLDEKAEILIPTLDEVAAKAGKAFMEIVFGADKAANSINRMFGTLDLNTKFSQGAKGGGHDSFAGFGLNAFGGWGDGSTPGGAGGVDPDSLYKDKDKGGKKGGAAKVDNSQRDADLKAITDSIAAARRGEQAKVSLYAEAVQVHMMTEQEKLTATKAALTEEYQAESKLLADELMLSNLSLKQKQAIEDQKKTLDEKYASDSNIIFMKSIQQQVQGWHGMVDTISGSLSSGLSGMIEGTQSFKQAMTSLAQSVERQFVKMGVDMVADWAKKQLTMTMLSMTEEGRQTAAAVAGASARTGVATGEATAISATTVASVLKNITASAAETFAGVFGFLSPVMGPLAAGPAAAAQGAVMSVAAFDIGAWSLDRDQLAVVHKNEMIMPAAQAGAFRDMLTQQSTGAGQPASSGAAGDTHVHLNASGLDSSSLKSYLGNNSRTLAKALNQAVKDGNHLGLRRLAGA